MEARPRAARGATSLPWPWPCARGYRGAEHPPAAARRTGSHEWPEAELGGFGSAKGIVAGGDRGEGRAADFRAVRKILKRILGTGHGLGKAARSENAKFRYV